MLLEDLGLDAHYAKKHASDIVLKIQAALSADYVQGNIRHSGSSSVGIRLFLGNADSPEKILKDADAAMYIEKMKSSEAVERLAN